MQGKNSKVLSPLISPYGVIPGAASVNTRAANPFSPPASTQRTRGRALQANVSSFSGLPTASESSSQLHSSVSFPNSNDDNDEFKDPLTGPIPPTEALNPQVAALADQVHVLTQLVLQLRTDATPSVANQTAASGSSSLPSSVELKSLQDELAALRLLVATSAKNPNSPESKNDSQGNLQDSRADNINRLMLDGQLKPDPRFSLLMGALGATSAKVPPPQDNDAHVSPYMITPSSLPYDPLMSPLAGSVLELNRQKLQADHEIVTAKQKKERELAFATKPAFWKHCDKMGYFRGTRPDHEAWMNLLCFITTLECSYTWDFIRDFLRKVWEKLFPEDGSTPRSLTIVLGPPPSDGHYDEHVSAHPLVQFLLAKRHPQALPDAAAAGGKKTQVTTPRPDASSVPRMKGSPKETATCTSYCSRHNGWFRKQSRHTAENCPDFKKGIAIIPHPASAP